MGGRDLRAAAWEGVVVHTRVAWLLGRARRAMGPVGRKRWKAVVVDEVLLGESFRVATTPCLS